MGLAERGPAWRSFPAAPHSHCSPSRISFLVLFSCYAGFFPSVLLPAECAGRDFPPGHLHLRIYIPKNQSPDGCGAVAGSGPFQVSYDLALFASAACSEAPAGIKTKALVWLPSRLFGSGLGVPRDRRHTSYLGVSKLCAPLGRRSGHKRNTHRHAEPARPGIPVFAPEHQQRSNVSGIFCATCSRGMGDSQRSRGQDVRLEIFSRPCCNCAG